MAAFAHTVLVTVGAVALTAACAVPVTGRAVRAAPDSDDHPASVVDVDGVLLEQSEMQSITGAGDPLTIVPTMDGKSPVDIDVFASRVPAQCAWLFAETQTFGSDVEDFHETTYQDPPQGALISQGAAGYRDLPTARGAFEALAGRVAQCGSTTSGFLATWTATGDAIELTQDSGCDRDYRVKSVVLVEVMSCAFSAPVPQRVMAAILGRIPG
ncbi:sensor domain-containing protein [Mycolicibacterium madagascariense]|uniref:Sensor domain-containing protein n=1 Tax=Mycolicibacterium madagascariense TaxID=212765 RepID=A0A7I7XF17_9MYCO|nr:sensor domain-containing protein [Mycolicibacterium madagascariense]MCV7011280.1 sensor domain-containing protein [Mycolicibacterium madagascariense]BBZ27779.1 sensor domain-containing protein [Mycolicibacterium madagascariense]